MQPSENPKETILLIDDHPSTLESYKGVLEDEGYHVVECLTYEQAKAEAAKQDFDFVISDLSKTDDMEAGFAFCRGLRQSGYGGPIIMHTNAIHAPNSKTPTDPELLRRLERKARVSGVNKLIAKHDISLLLGAMKDAEQMILGAG